MGLELNYGGGNAQVDEGLGFHVEEFEEEGDALEALGNLYAFEGHAFGVGFG